MNHKLVKVCPLLQSEAAEDWINCLEIACAWFIPIRDNKAETISQCCVLVHIAQQLANIWAGIER